MQGAARLTSPNCTRLLHTPVTDRPLTQRCCVESVAALPFSRRESPPHALCCHVEEGLLMTSAAILYPPRSPAPWAEVAPGCGPVTVDMLLELPDDGYIYEVVEGVLVRIAGSANRATRLALRLAAHLNDHAESHRLGVVTGADGVYRPPIRCWSPPRGIGRPASNPRSG
jgi:hypothetical protein